MAIINTTYFTILLFALVYGNEDSDSSKELLCVLNPTTSMGSYIGNFIPEELDPHLCTHIIHNAGVIDSETHDIVSRDPPGMHDNDGIGIYNKTLKLKDSNPQLKVLLQVCCFRQEFWEHDDKTHDQAILTFIKNAVTHLERHGFDGLVIALDNNPKVQQLLRGLREEFDKKGFLLFLIIYPVEALLPNRFELTQENSTVFDRIIVAEYWSLNHHHATIFSPLNDLRKLISDYKQVGIPSKKFIAAIPTLALSYKLCNASETGISAPLCGDGDEGQEHPVKMILIYSELTQKMRNVSEGWVVQRDDETGMLYGHSKSQLWASFEDPVSVRAKAQFVREENLGGLAMMTVEMDDAMGYNENGVKLPLTRAARDGLRGN